MDKKIPLVLMLFALSLLLAGCLHTGAYTGPYTAGTPSVLVKPTIKVWIKPGATEEEERQALGECGDELRSNEQLRKEQAKFDEDVKNGLRKRPSRGSPDPWSAAFKACMQRKGFRHFRDKH